MEFISFLFSNIQGIYASSVSIILDIYLNLFGIKYASFLTGFTIMLPWTFYLFRKVNGKMGLPVAIRIPGFWIYNFILTAVWLLLSQNANPDFTLLPIYFIFIIIYVGVSIDSQAIIISKGIDRSIAKSKADE
jgi:hypothetical protein